MQQDYPSNDLILYHVSLAYKVDTKFTEKDIIKYTNYYLSKEIKLVFRIVIVVILKIGMKLINNLNPNILTTIWTFNIILKPSISTIYMKYMFAFINFSNNLIIFDIT